MPSGHGWKLLVVSCFVARARKTCSRDFDLERQVAMVEMLVGLGEMFRVMKNWEIKWIIDVTRRPPEIETDAFPVRFVLDDHDSFESQIDEKMFRWKFLQCQYDDSRINNDFFLENVGFPRVSESSST